MPTFPQLQADLAALAQLLAATTGMSVYSESMAVAGRVGYALGRKGIEKCLIVAAPEADQPTDFTTNEPLVSLPDCDAAVKLCPLTHQNAQALRKHLPFLVPVTLGVAKSFGGGDRLGIATPGHVRAVRKGSMRPIFCQQSIREMTRTDRSPDDVMDDACWGVFQTGYRDGFGADADHLKTTADIDRCLAAGFTFFTVDPGEHVDGAADDAEPAALLEKFAQLPWPLLQSSANDCKSSYADKTFKLDGPDKSFQLNISGDDLLRAAVKYGRAIAHVAVMYRHLEEKAVGKPFEFEISVDETEKPTSVAEHYYIAAELRRLGIEWVSLAPRFVGDFEKGVDYIGDLEQFRITFGRHIAIAKQLGPYKLSLHSGSDKFSVYPIAAALAGELVHLKTAGTSYLEALRAVARVDTELFREILAFAKDHYPQDRATYHVSAVVEKVADPADLSDEQLPVILDQFDTRQACHVTYGSVLGARKADGSVLFAERLFRALRQHEEVYYEILDQHIGRHIQPFS